MKNIKFNIENHVCEFNYKNLSLEIGNDKVQYKGNANSNPKRLYLIFSKLCNLSCDYCFQKNDRKNFVVQYQDDEILKIIDNVVDQYEIIVLFGGEPLLKENYHIICQLFEQYKNKKFVIFTNGTFDPDYLELLTSNKEIIQAVLVSLDGNRELHNKIRYESKGLKKEGTFDKILNNVKIMIERNISPQIQINCTKNNLSTIDDMIDEVFEKLEEDDFSLLLNPVKYTDYGISHLELLKKFKTLKEKYPNLYLSLNSRLYNNLILLFEENKINYSRCDVEQSMVIDFSSGKVYKCSQNENSIVGIIEKDKIKKFTNKCDAYRMKSTYAIKQCQQCGLVNFCFHGCANTIVDYDNCQIEVYDNLHYLLDNLDIFFDIEIE